MVERNTSTINQLSDDRSDVVGFGRLLRNEKVQPARIIDSLTKSVNEFADGRHVLVINDTTELNYQDHINFLNPADPDLGPTGNNKDIGFFLHTGLVIDPELDFGLGFSYVKIWNRKFDKADKLERKYKSLPIEEKESFRWIECGLESKKNLSSAKLITIVADRESDIYEEFAVVPDDKTHLLIRACRDRQLHGKSGSLYETLASSELKGNYSLEIKTNKKTGRAARKTKMEVRFTKVKIKRPISAVNKDLPEFMEVYAVEAKENPLHVPKGEKPVHWRLLTTHVITTIEEALKVIQWYGMRWHIEMLFTAMKSKGLDIEASEVETGKGLKVLCLMAMLAALKINQLRQAREDKTEIPANICFTKKEQEVIKHLIKKKTKGKTEKQKCPYKEGTLAWAAWLIARLGGWKGYASESKPGIKTMTIGLKRFQSIVIGWNLFQELCA
jgi:hypothetical protein